MNPSSASIPSAPPRVVNDIAGPTPASSPTSPMPAPAPSLVANIPVHNQAAPVAPANEDVELDKIMHDVGQEMKKEDLKPHKHGLLGFGHKPKTSVVLTTRAISQPPPAAQQPVSQPTPMPAPPAARAAAIPQPQVAPPAIAKAPKQSSIPVFVVFVAFVVTGFLTVAAFVAYRP